MVASARQRADAAGQASEVAKRGSTGRTLYATNGHWPRSGIPKKLMGSNQIAGKRELLSRIQLRSRWDGLVTAKTTRKGNVRKNDEGTRKAVPRHIHLI